MANYMHILFNTGSEAQPPADPALAVTPTLIGLQMIDSDRRW